MDLSTKRLVLREMTWDDVDLIHELHSMKEVDEFSTIGIPRHTGDTLAVLLAAIEDPGAVARMHFGWTIWCTATREFIGEAGLDLSADRFRSGELFYSLSPAHWGKGYGTEIVKRLITFGFADLQLHRIQAGVATDNLRSVKVLEKAGMTCEGIRRKALPIRGEWKDNFHYAIVEDDPFTP